MGLPLACAALASFSAPSLAQESPASPSQRASPGWTIGATAAEQSVGHGLPVLALDGPDWPSHRSGQPANPRAWRSIHAELNAMHPTGWRIGALARAEARLQASADAVTLGALIETKSDPDAAHRYSVQAHSQGWQGEGLQVGTPWWPVGAAGRWQWQADAQVLRLRQLRLDDISGSLQYNGGGAYDAQLQSQRSNLRITSPFMPASGSAGLGASLSLALQGQPAPGWRVQLRADDLLSRLQWPDLATDTSTLDTQVSSRAPDGSLDYGPLLKGQRALRRVTSRMGVHWQAEAAWSVFEGRGQPGAVTLRASRKAEINQWWLGWDSGSTGRDTPRWRMEFEPLRHAAQLQLAWGGWQFVVATDGQGAGTQYRRLQIGWQTGF